MDRMQHEMVTIQGSVDQIIYHNNDSAFTVLDLIYGDELVCVVGTLGDVQAGEELELTGYFTSHPTYGYQFKAEACSRTMPATASAILKYLSSGVIKGIGPATAKRIVEAFGDDTLKILEESPERLAEVKGITKKKCAEFSQQFQQVFGVRSLMLYLSKYAVPPATAVQIWKKWGALAMDVLKANPYQLCSFEFSLPFETADRIAMDAGKPKDDYHRILAGVSYVLQYNLNNGHTCLPREKVLPMAQKILGLDTAVISDAVSEAISLDDLRSIQRRKEFLMLPIYDDAERYIAARVGLMISIPPDDPPDLEGIIEQIERTRGIQYEALQKNAICQAMRSELFILTGGPGTGKTTTLNGILDVLEYRGQNIALAAPTGRAAKRMSEVTGREAKTIHRLLEVEFADEGHRFTKNEQEPLDADVVIIDEMSMVDVLLFEALLRAVRPGAKLILVGDYNQLPSVGAGNVLQDLLDADVVPTVSLRRIFRQAAQSQIVTNAHLIVQGEMPDLTQKEGDFFFLSRSSVGSAAQTVVDLICTRLPRSYGYSPFTDIQVLCPQRKGELGVMELNRRLQTILNPKDPRKAEFKSFVYTYRVGDKVMQIKNNYDIEWTRDTEHGQGIFNGDIGIIQMIDRGSQTMAIDFEGRIAYYSFDLANELELAYAITVHKSQGSEFEAIIVPVLGGYDKLYYRNLLYTAVTRAKKILILVGSEDRVRFMVQNHIKSVRYTNLRILLERQVQA
jgi:exodeoxyribonuclease V alpha subunit